MAGLPVVDAVSYTHLDMYKRQIRAMLVEGDSSFWWRKRQRPVKVRGLRPRHKSVVEKSTTELSLIHISSAVIGRCEFHAVPKHILQTLRAQRGRVVIE